MASTGSREIQEDIVGPLMDMMGSLSEEMRKNLSKEVSSINRRLDELSKKVDHLISRTGGNNFGTKGNHTFVSEQSAFTRPATPSLPPQAGEGELFPTRKNICSDESDDYSIVTGRSPTEFDRKFGRSDPYKAEEKLPEDSYSAEPSGFNKQTVHNNSEGKRVTANEKHTEVALNDDANGKENTTVSKMPVDKKLPKPEPKAEIDGYADGSDPEIETEKVERDKRPKDVFEPSMRGKPAQKQGNKDMDMEMENTDKRFESSRKPVDTTSPDQSLSGRKRRGLFNFGNTGVHKRPQSPPPTSDNKHNVSYTKFKKTRTEFATDNRTKYLKNAFNITETNILERDQQTPDKADINTDLPYKKMKRDQNQKDDTLSKGTTDEVANKSIPAMVTYPGQSQKIGEKSKNQQPAPSGFKNEHGDDDNRFIAAAHDERPHASVMRRGFDLSNLKLVKNGPRRPVNGTDAGSRRPDGGATELLQLPEKSLMQEDNGSGKLVSDDVLYSIIEKERLSAGECSDIKSHGIDTVICLDTSSSMAGKPLTTAIHTVTKILDGFETNAIYHDLEENVALVTFGNENKIRCHLTNDYGVIREGLENITAGGPSPLWLGLALSLAEIKERGGACGMDPTTVLPRIILITDGFASRKNLLAGEDSSVVDDQVLREILSLMSTCTSFTSYMECIIPGPCHEEFLSSLTNGRMYTTDDLEHVVEFFRVQEKANDIVKKISSGEMDRSEIGEAINTSKLGEKGKDDLKKILSEGLPSNDQQNEDSNTSEEDKTMEKPKSLEGEIQDKQPDSIPPQSLDMSDDVEAPSFGTAVVANPEWVGFASRQNFTGTIIGARKKGFMKVLWSDGTMEKCKFGVNGNYDFQVSKDQAVDCSHLHTGSLVARGRDWRWKDQDGGEGSVGVVLKVDGPVVHVIWPHGGQGNYRYGYNKKFDLALCKTRRNTTEETNFAWYIEEEEGQWRPFPTEVNESIENMHKTNHAGTFLVKMDEKSLRVSIQHLQARDPNTQLTYNIERRESSIEE